MSIRSDPVLTPLPKQRPKNNDYTKITFEPGISGSNSLMLQDLEKFKMTSLQETDILPLMKRRVYDIAGCNEGVNVYLNGELLPNSFESYLSLYRYH